MRECVSVCVIAQQSGLFCRLLLVKLKVLDVEEELVGIEEDFVARGRHSRGNVAGRLNATQRQEARVLLDGLRWREGDACVGECVALHLSLSHL